jgi:hypothetical protein
VIIEPIPEAYMNEKSTHVLSPVMDSEGRSQLVRGTEKKPGWVVLAHACNPSYLGG